MKNSIDRIMKGSTGMRRFSGMLARVAVVAAAITGFGVGTPASAMYLNAISPAQRGVAADVVRTHGDVRDLGRLGAAKPVRIGVMLKYRNEAELATLILAQGNKRSPYYHHYLSIGQWDNYFAPTAATYAKVQQELLRAGFRIEQTFANRGMIRAIATANVAERYFRTQFHQVSQVGRGLRYVNVTPAIMPPELKNDVISVVGLHSIVSKHFPIRISNAARAAIRSHRYARSPVATNIVPAATPKPITTSTPSVTVPGPDPTESPSNVIVQFAEEMGYGPPVYADAYDFPVQHGYGGHNQAAGTVIDSDNSDADEVLEATTFGVDRTGIETRVCTDPNNACTICNDSTTTTAAATCDQDGESSLDAETIMTLAPAVHLYEYLTNSTDSIDDLDVAAAYERIVSDNLVDAVNSSFGECETDDPSAEYEENYIAMEGVAEGITFSASAGDTGATSCGLYAGNGTPQSEFNVSEPAAAPYFTAVGGTTFQEVVSCTGVGSDCYTNELGWMDGGGGVSVYEPQPSWQTSLVGAGTTLPIGVASLPAASSGRDVPDVAFEADPDTGVAEVVFIDGTEEPVGGTSLSSPTWVAMQTEIDEVQSSRNGFVNPRLYAIANTSSAEYSFAFRDILLGDNVVYPCGPGYDLVTGIGSVLGWELAGTE